MKHWPTIPLSQVVTCLDSERIPVKEDERQKRFGSVPYYGANGRVGWIDEAIFNEPLLLIAEDGGHFGEPERGVAYTIRGPSWVNNHAHVLRPDESRVLLDFLGYHFRHFDFQPYITGTTRAKLTQRDLMRVEIPVPPVVEQERIVKLLDEADELRNLRAQADNRTAALIPALFNEMFSGADSKNWMEHTFGEAKVMTIIDGDRGTKYPKKTDFRDSGNCLFLNTSNVRKGTFDFSKCDFITHEKDKALRKGKLTRGDVILTTRGTLGNSAHYDNAVVHENVRINSGMVILRTNPAVLLPEHLLVVLNSDGFTNQISMMISGSAQPQLPINRLSKIKFVLPPLPLQKELAQRATEIRELEGGQDGSRRRLDDLFKSMLHRGFKGEL
jgi:type I restriction enzyme S subunit